MKHRPGQKHSTRSFIGNNGKYNILHNKELFRSEIRVNGVCRLVATIDKGDRGNVDSCKVTFGDKVDLNWEERARVIPAHCKDQRTRLAVIIGSDQWNRPGNRV